MTTLAEAIAHVRGVQMRAGKPPGVILAKHSGSGKSTPWRDALADMFRIPLINADRMMLSVLPEARSDGHLPAWAAALRDGHRGWMGVAQLGVQSFAGHAIAEAVKVADALILLDNGRTPSLAFTARRVQLGATPVHDVRDGGRVSGAVSERMDAASPRRG